MSPPPHGVGPVPSPARSDTKNSERPITGVGQKSAAVVLIGAPRLRGSPQGDVRLARSAAQMSLPPNVPARFEAMNRLRPSADSIGQPSAAVELTSVTATASAHSEWKKADAPPAWADDVSAQMTALASNTLTFM